MRTTIEHWVVAAVTGALAFSIALNAGAVGTRRIELRNGKDLKGGDMQGVAIDANGRVRAGFNLGGTPVPDATAVWSALHLSNGTVLLGTGNDGKLLAATAGQVSVVGETGALVVTSLVEGWGGTVFAATLPDGEIWQYKGGKVSKFTTLKDVQHIWQLAFDAKAQVLYAATGPDGKLFRIDRNANAQVYFDADEQHLMSVALQGAVVFTGASDKAKLYQVEGPGRASVFYDFDRTEVRGILPLPNGDLFVIANEIKGGGAPTRKDRGIAGPVSGSSDVKGKGILYKFSKGGTPEQLLEDDDEHFVSIAVDESGAPYVGTGAEGRVYTVDQNHNSVLVADTAERQVGALLLGKGERYVVTSDPPMLRPVRGVGGADSVWTSKALDAGLRARFGRISWNASGKVEISTRTGNTAEPDATWSAWSPGLVAPAVVGSPAARFIQVRARFNQDKDAALTDLTIPFLTDNLRAVITQVGSKDSDGSSEGSLQSSGGPIEVSTKTALDLKWEVYNPDKDELRYRLQYRLVGTTQWYEMLKPNEVLTKSSYSWQTSDLPEGEYRVRVVATDELSNPPANVTKHEFESETLLVDNTAPAITGLAVNGRRVRGVAVDGVGPIQRVEASVAGSGDWFPFFPTDGIFDEQSEDFDLDLSGISPSGRALITIRAFDAANNAVIQGVTLR